MTTIKPWGIDGKESTFIATKGVKETEKVYLDKVGIKLIREASLPDAIKLFVLIIEDFKKGKLSSDELSALGFEIFHGLAKRFPESDLFQASLSAAELSFAIRSKDCYGSIHGYLSDIDNFYSVHKNN